MTKFHVVILAALIAVGFFQTTFAQRGMGRGCLTNGNGFGANKLCAMNCFRMSQGSNWGFCQNGSCTCFHRSADCNGGGGKAENNANNSATSTSRAARTITPTAKRGLMYVRDRSSINNSINS